SRGDRFGFERVESDDLLDAGRLELEMLLGQALDALSLVEMGPFDPQDVRGLLALDDLLVGAVDLLLEVLHLVLDREQADRRGDGCDRPEQEPTMDHARLPIFSATRRRAERARGLAATSAADGITGLRVRSRKAAGWASARGGA